MNQKKNNYNQFTGEGCCGDRVQVLIKDAPYPVLYLPIDMMHEPVLQELIKEGSISKLISKYKTLTQELWDSFYIKFCELRYKYDFEFYAIICLTISDKLTSQDIPFKLNRGQRRLLARLEEMRLSGRPIRVILLKARQWGGSTLIQMYMSWIQMIHKKNWNSVICAHTKDNSINIRSMFEKVIKNIPNIENVRFSIKDFAKTQNIKHVPERGCRITVGSAEEPDSVRSQDAKMAHFSEIGLYPNTEKKKTEDLIASITGSIPRIPYTLIAYESTARGVGDFFYEEWQRSEKGESVFEPVFVPWFLIDIYREEFDGTYYNNKGKKVKGTKEDFKKSLNEYELNLYNNHADCELENLNWYRGKLSEMTSHALMKQEYPSDPIEAFQNSGTPAFRAEDIEQNRDECYLPEYVGEIMGDSSPALAKMNPEIRKNVLTNVRFFKDETSINRDPKSRERAERNKLKVWSLPDEVKLKHRYVVIVDTGGRGEKADFSVICVMDRFWMQYGGVPEVVAEWRGHVDHDILVWISAQISVFYDNALLVIESNTHETEKNDGDHSEFIFDTIAEYYSNLYSRVPADKIKEGIPAKWGWHTNTATKTMIIDNFVATLREKGYKERNEEALNEARWYEKNKDGKYGAIQGKHDDILMTRMIGVKICYDLPIPTPLIEEKQKKKKIINETSF